MADKYVRSLSSGGGATGVDWANAYLTLTAAAAAAAAGDNIWVAADHAETSASAITIAVSGTSASPVRIMCADNTGSVPPVAADLRTTASITSTGASTITFSTGAAYVYGLIFNCGTGANTANFGTTAGFPFYLVNCAINLPNTSTSSLISINSTQELEWVNVTTSFGSVQHKILVNNCNWVWRGSGSGVTGATFPTTLISLNANRSGVLRVENIDFSNIGSGKSIFTQTTAHGLKAQIINCKISAAVTLNSTFPTSQGGVIENIGSDSGTASYRFDRYTFGGTQTVETTIVRSGGGSDGTTNFSNKAVSSASAKYYSPLEMVPISIWNNSVGSALTATVEIVNDGLTLTNGDIRLEVVYLNSSSFVTTSIASSGLSDILATSSNLATSTATWVTTGLASPVKQKMQVTFTPLMKGPVRIYVRVTRPSTTVYIDPSVTIA